MFYWNLNIQLLTDKQRNKWRSGPSFESLEKTLKLLDMADDQKTHCQFVFTLVTELPVYTEKHLKKHAKYNVFYWILHSSKYFLACRFTRIALDRISPSISKSEQAVGLHLQNIYHFQCISKQVCSCGPQGSNSSTCIFHRRPGSVD